MRMKRDVSVTSYSSQIPYENHNKVTFNWTHQVDHVEQYCLGAIGELTGSQLEPQSYIPVWKKSAPNSRI